MHAIKGKCVVTIFLLWRCDLCLYNLKLSVEGVICRSSEWVSTLMCSELNLPLIGVVNYVAF